jgi:hypothetical protein
MAEIIPEYFKLSKINGRNATVRALRYGFLSLSIPKVLKEALRPSYVLWEERQLPILVLEVVSPTYRGEYTLPLFIKFLVSYADALVDGSDRPMFGAMGHEGQI